MSRVQAIGEILDDLSIEAPDSRMVFCVACSRLTVPDERWRCSHCRVLCKFGQTKMICDHCCNPTFAPRKGYRTGRPACRCQDTPEQRDSYRRGMAGRERREFAEDAKELAARAARNQRETLTRAATNCLREKVRIQGGCSVRRNEGPLDACKFCPKFREKPVVRPPGPPTPPLTPPPMADYDLED